MKIKVKGELPQHIKDLGVRPGQEYDAFEEPGTRLDAVSFMVDKDDEMVKCTLLPKYFKKL
jgi:hypothetical protein